MMTRKPGNLPAVVNISVKTIFVRVTQGGKHEKKQKSSCKCSGSYDVRIALSLRRQYIQPGNLDGGGF